MDKEALAIEGISLEEYEVVCGEYVSQADKSCVTFNGLVVSFNAASLKILLETESILFMINRRDNSLCVRPCRNGEKSAFRWCTYGKKRKPRQGACEEFVLRLMKLTSWTFDYRYKLLGSVVTNNGINMIKFNLDLAKKFPRKNVEDERLNIRAKRDYLEEGNNGAFGLSLAEYEKEISVPTFQEDATIIVGADKDGDV
ncbi:MAG: hypothetical protein LBU56_02460 [Rickettsiales bacterium]|jgi:hypothetical protein|nr:hypothetical protein [Rickettsiales bacterium]